MAGFFTAKYMLTVGNMTKIITRDFFLPDARAVREEIAKIGGTPLQVRHKKLSLLEQEFVTRKYKSRFLRAVGFHINAGMSPGKALYLVIESETNTRKRYHLEPALEILRRGGTFMVAMRQLDFFDDGILAILSAGEQSGQMAEVINSAIAHLEEKGKTWKILTAALGWLWFDIGTAVSTVIGVQFGYLPWVEKNGIDTKDALAKQKFEHALEIAYLINGVLLAIAVVVVVLSVAVVLVAVMAKLNKDKQKLGEAPKKKTSSIVYQIPFVKQFVEDTGIAETFGIVGRMLKGKVQFQESVAVAIDSSPIPSVKSLWQNALQRIQKGDTIDRALRSPVLTRPELLELGAHANSDQLASIFLNIASERGEASKRGLRQMIMAGILLTIFYTFAAAGSAMWVLWVQNEGLTKTLDGLGGGGF